MKYQLYGKSLGGVFRMENRFKHPAEEVRRQIEAIMLKTGFLCRVFARGKDERSLQEKLRRETNKYSLEGKLVQDAIGVRVVLYFEEDIDIVAKILSSQFEVDHEGSTVDSHGTDQFKVTRHNLILKLPEQYLSDFSRSIRGLPIDSTFEVQLRTVLSEGWHEVDHDLRYKSKSSWNGHDDLSRALNGILATIETAEWSMRRIFDDLAYRHYKKKNWSLMLHSKIRMRVNPALSEEILHILDSDANFGKEILRINRTSLLRKISTATPNIPITLDNIIYVWNFIGPRHAGIISLTPDLIIEAIGGNAVLS